MTGRRIKILRVALLAAGGVCYAVALLAAFSNDLGIALGALAAGAALLTADRAAVRHHLRIATRQPDQKDTR